MFRLPTSEPRKPPPAWFTPPVQVVFGVVCIATAAWALWLGISGLQGGEVMSATKLFRHVVGRHTEPIKYWYSIAVYLVSGPCAAWVGIVLIRLGARRGAPMSGR